jgi:hypothetical protein
MNPTSICLLIAAISALTIPLRAETEQPTPTATALPAAIASPAATEAPSAYEPIPTLNASEILQPQYFQGPNFKVRNAVPTYSGSNHYTIDSDFGVFEADGNQMLMRRVAEINAIARLESISQTKEFTRAAEKAAKVPLQVAQDLINNPVSTLSSVPRGIWGFLNQAGQAVKEATEGRESTPAEGNAVANLTGFSKTKRDLAIKLGVDPYSTNEVFQKELNKVDWPAFLGKFTVSLGMAAVSGGAGVALSAANWTNTLTEALRDKSPAELRLMNLGLLTNNMGVDRAVAVAFLNNNAISPSTQTLLVAALAQLERANHGRSEQERSGRPHQPSQRSHCLPDQRRHRGRSNSVGLRSLDADDRAIYYRAQGQEIHASRHGLLSYPDRRHLADDRPSPGRAQRQRHHQSASRPIAIGHISLNRIFEHPFETGPASTNDWLMSH